MLSEQTVRMLRQSVLEDANRDMTRIAGEGRAVSDLTLTECEAMAAQVAVIAVLSSVLEDEATFDWKFLDIITG